MPGTQHLVTVFESSNKNDIQEAIKVSILSWFKAVTSGGSQTDLIQSEKLTFGQGEDEFKGLNMREALDAHAQWTQRLESKINGTSNEELEVSKVACDDQCALGKWIHGEAHKQFSAMNSYKDLKQVHADFHLTAGAVLNNVLNGEAEKAREQLKQVRFKSGNVQLALVRLYSDAQQ